MKVSAYSAAGGETINNNIRWSNITYTKSFQDEIDSFGNGPNSDKFQLYVNVIDIGDNPPGWQKYPSTFALEEGTPEVYEIKRMTF